MTERRVDLGGWDEPARVRDDQREWFVDTITGSETTWAVWADEVLTVPLRIGNGPSRSAPCRATGDGYTGNGRR